MAEHSTKIKLLTGEQTLSGKPLIVRVKLECESEDVDLTDIEIASGTMLDFIQYAGLTRKLERLAERELQNDYEEEKAERRISEMQDCPDGWSFK